MRLRELRSLTEAPIGDIQHIGDFSKGSSFRKEVDRKMVTNPRMIQRMRSAFKKTSYDFDIFFVNSPGMGNHRETGVVDWDWIDQNMPKVAPTLHQMTEYGTGIKSNSINIIFTNNTAAEHVPMTPWIMAHRIAHTMRRNSRNARRTQYGPGYLDFYFEEAENAFVSETSQILSTCYGRTDLENIKTDSQLGQKRENQLLYMKFWESIGTFRSARENNLRQDFEMLNEMFAQNIIQGKITFRPPPNHLRVPVRGWSGMTLVLKDEEREYAHEAVETFARTMTYYLDAILGANVGNIYVM